jgi:glycosyltransferase involved in cell wall biosynthesis
MTEPRVTVLLAVRNGEPYLREAVESVLAQSFGDLELLVVDDASDDGTAAFLAGLSDDRVHVLTNVRNLGQVASLNLGLEHARGVYVARLDHDDVCLPTRLERQVAILDAEPEVAVVGSWSALVDQSGHAVGTARQSIRDYVEFVYWNLVAWVLIPHPSATFRRDVVRELGGYDPALGPSEDKDLWRRLALARHEARIVEEELIRYRLHTGQLSRVQEERQRRNDATSHEAFLRALAGEAVDVRRLRLLLTADPALFAGADNARGVVADVRRLLAGVAERLALTAPEQARLERLVRARVARAARTGWSGGIGGWWRGSAPLAAYGIRRGGTRAVADALVYALELPAAPALAVATRGARRATRTLVRSRAVQPLESRARRSRLARRAYAWLAGRR